MEPLLSHGDLTISQNGGHRHLVFSKDWNLLTRASNEGVYGSEGQCGSLFKFSCWSVKPLLRYCDFSIFSVMAAVRHP